MPLIIKVAAYNISNSVSLQFNKKFVNFFETFDFEKKCQIKINNHKNYDNDLPLRSKKAERFEKMLHFDSSQPIVTRGSRVSRPPTHNTLLLF